LVAKRGEDVDVKGRWPAALFFSGAVYDEMASNDEIDAGGFGFEALQAIDESNEHEILG